MKKIIFILCCLFFFSCSEEEVSFDCEKALQEYYSQERTVQHLEQNLPYAQGSIRDQKIKQLQEARKDLSALKNQLTNNKCL